MGTERRDICRRHAGYDLAILDLAVLNRQRHACSARHCRRNRLLVLVMRKFIAWLMQPPQTPRENALSLALILVAIFAMFGGFSV